eukprot:snap_masked-scaffold_1-processed-gene-3.11-mRNA-1 protein AED:0.04 eAED:0.07 QI:0/-1/0/1/-1/1/1/0/331
MSKKIKLSSIPIFKQDKTTNVKNAIKILSINIPGLRKLLTTEERKEKFDNLFNSQQPDILLLQEHKLQEIHLKDESVKKFCKNDLEDYEQYWNFSTAKKGYSGVATFVKKSLGLDHKLVHTELPGCKLFQNEGRVCILEFNSFFLMNCYTPNSGQKLNRLNERVNTWDRAFSSWLKKAQENKPVVCVGDLNCAFRTQDIHNFYNRPQFPHLGFLTEEEYTGNKAILKQAGCTLKERISFKKVLRDGNIVDSFTHFYPKAEGAFTYWSHRSGNRPPNKGLRLDYILASPSLLNEESKDKIVDVFHLDNLDRDGSWGISDHCPVGFLLKLEEQ